MNSPTAQISRRSSLVFIIKNMLVSALWVIGLMLAVLPHSSRGETLSNNTSETQSGISDKQTLNEQTTDEQIVVYGRAITESQQLRSFDASQLADGYRNLGEFLASLNGVQVQALGGMGDPVLVSIQGASTNQTRVLVNGVLQNSGQFGHYDLADIPLSNIERIDVITSASDSSDGSVTNDQAIGGTINIITRNADQSSQQLQLGAGSYGTLSANLNASANILGTPVAVSVDHQQSDNNYSYAVPNPQNSSQLYVKQDLNNAAFRKDRIDVSASLSGTQVQAWWQDREKQLPQYARNSTRNRALLTSKQHGLRLSGHWGNDWYQSWSLSHSLERQAYKDPLAIFSYTTNDDHYRYQNTEASLSSQFGEAATGWEHWLFTLQAQGKEQTYASRYSSPLSNSDNCNGLGSQCDQFSWLQEWQAGGQVEWQNNDLTLSLASTHHQQTSMARTLQGTSSSDGESTIKWPSTTASIKQGFVSEHSFGSVHLNWKRALRIPSLYERFGDQGMTRGNADLTPELGRTLTAGFDIEADVFAQPSLAVTVFRRQLENTIVVVYDPSTGSGRYENSADAIMKGLEWQLKSRLDGTQSALGSWQLSLAGSHYSSTSSSDTKSYDNKQLPSIYHQRLLSKLQWQSVNQATRISLENELAGDIYLDRSNTVSGEDRNLWNLNIRRDTGTLGNWVSQSSVGLRVKNLSNHEFTDFSSRPAPAREWNLYLTCHY